MEETKFMFSNCTLFNGQLFFVEVNSGLPALMDLRNGDVHYCGLIQNYIHQAGDHVDCIDSCQQKIYMLDRSGNNLIILDLEKNECYYRELNCGNSTWGSFSAFERYKKEYYIFPKYGEEIFAVNTDNDETRKIDKGFCGLDEVRCCCRAGNEVWILPDGKKVLGAFDLVHETMKIYELKEGLENIVSAVYVDENIFFLNFFGNIYKWNIRQKQMVEMKTLKAEPDEKESMCRIVYVRNQLIVFPALGRDIKILDLSSNETYIYQGYPSDFIYHEKGWSKFDGYCEDDQYIYFAMRMANYVLKIDKQCGEFIWIKPNIPSGKQTKRTQDLFFKEKTKTEYSRGRVYFPESEWMIVDLLKMDLKSNKDKKREAVGKKIYEETFGVNATGVKSL